MNYWEITDEQRTFILPIIKEYDKYISEDWKNDNEEEAVKGCELNFTRWPVAPRQIQTLFETIGYETTDTETEGWDGNLWIYMRPKDRRPLAFYEDSIAIQRCAMTFELYVRVCGVD